MLKITDTTLEINKRFFDAIMMLRRQRKLRGIQSFARKYGLSTGNLIVIKNNGSGAIKAEYIAYLCRDYNISAEWVLLGKGEMFTHKPSKTEESPLPETSASE